MKQPSNESSIKPSKKPYEPPKLLIYGDLNEMTQQKGKSGKKDGGTKLLHKQTGP